MKAIESVKLNDNEKEVLTAILHNAIDASGGDFACSDEVVHYLKKVTKAQLGAYVTSLKKKEIIEVHPSGEGFNQITFTDDFKYLVEDELKSGEKNADDELVIPAEKKLSNKARVYKAWKDGNKNQISLHELVDKKVKLSTINSWLSGWRNGKNLPSIAK